MAPARRQGETFFWEKRATRDSNGCPRLQGWPVCHTTPYANAAATVICHRGRALLRCHWVNPQGRPIPIITQGGRAITELI